MKQTKLNKMRRAFSLFVVAVCCMAGGCELYAQSGVRVSGTVVDVDNVPLVGVVVIEKGLSNGTVTDADGRFVFEVSQEGATIELSSLGYSTKEFEASSLNGKTIVLEESADFIEETVVVGYAVQKKVNLTGSVSAVNMDEVLNGRPVTNLSSGLSGLSAGLYVNQSTGRPNADGASLLVRGRGTLNTASPLVIIDGIEGDMSNVNPQDVESVSVLKDASSAAIYGSRAANGVVLITTKKGTDGRFSLNYNGYVSVQEPSNLLETVSDYADYMTYYNEAVKNTDPTAKQQYDDQWIKLWRENKDDTLKYPNTNWAEEVINLGVSHNHALSFSAGTKRVSVFGSLGYLNNPGIVENSAFERYNARVNVNAQVTNWLTLGMNVSGKTSVADIGSDSVSSIFAGMGGMPGMTYRAPDGRYGGVENPDENAQCHSPLYLLNKYQGDIKSYNVNTRFFGKADIIKGLSLEGSVNYSYSSTIKDYSSAYEDLWSFRTNTVIYANSDKTFVYNGSSNADRLLMDAVLRYNVKVAGKLDIGALVGTSQERYRSHAFNGKRYDLIDDRLSVINAALGDSELKGGKEEWAMRSFFGRLNLTWDDRYLFEANLRADGSSRFASGKNRWGFFPSFSAGWRLSEEGFLKDVAAVNQLKLRASWGSLGNNAVGNYEWQSVYNKDSYILNNTLAPGLSIQTISNAGLTWETTYVTNVGVDFEFFNSKLEGTLDLFDKDTQNILIELPAPLLVGNAKVPTQNAARVNNKGVELSLKWRDRVGDFNYFISGNGSYVRNKVTKYKGDEATISGVNMIKEGYPINVQYVLAVDRIIQTNEDLMLVKLMQKNAPVDPATGQKKNPFAAYGTPQLGDFLYKDLNEDGVIDENDRYAVGNGNTPTWIYGFQFGFDWKGLDFSALFQGVAGYKVMWKDDFNMGYLVHGGQMSKEIVEGAWRPGMTDASYPRLLARTNTINDQPSDFWIEDKSYLRLKNVQLGYTLPSKWMSRAGISKLRFYVAGENLLTFTKYRGIDPEVGGTNYPTLRQYIFGINLTF